MKRFCVLLPLFLVMLSCTRDWNNPFETDTDLSHPPLITNIQLDNSNRLMLYLDYSYSSDCTLLFERKSASAFDPVILLPITTSVYADTTLDMEQNYNLVYRLRVQKNGYTSDYSNEKQFSYVSNVLNAPSGLSCNSIELQGVRLNWLDNSNKETGFRIEKNVNGSGFAEAADLAANTTTWLDAISGMPDPPQSIIYRIRAYNNNLNSAWTDQNVIYSGLGAPTNLHVTNSNFWEFTIAWTGNSTIATGYQIERKKDDGAYTILASVGAAVQTYTTELYENGSYSFRVKAIRNFDSSTYSNELIQQINIVMPTTGLIAYYPFNGNANDESGNGHNGVVYGASLALDRFGQPNESYNFDGSDDHIDFGTFIPDLSTLTVSFWHKQSGSGSGVVFCDEDQAPGRDLNMRVSNSTVVYTSGKVTESFGAQIDTGITFVDEFRNVVWIVSSNYSSLYVDGELIDTKNGNASNIGYHGFIMGTEYFNNSYGWQGWLSGIVDDFRIYNHALTESEIKALYHEGGWTGAK